MSVFVEPQNRIEEKVNTRILKTFLFFFFLSLPATFWILSLLWDEVNIISSSDETNRTFMFNVGRSDWRPGGGGEGRAAVPSAHRRFWAKMDPAMKAVTTLIPSSSQFLKLS